ncbi:hypothetical protein ACQUQU_09175 [Thalassolituus sp. LLYu03]|uniref:hypothetical protein n=1 Tax=Thalassolituus sp. LLYu03 TaxID=3421656 RepID=UPI003D2A76FB
MDINNSSSGYQNLLNLLAQQSSQSSVSADALNEAAQSASPLTRTVSVGESDKVSVSLRAERLNQISKEYFSGAISSDQIPALTQRLYEDGFLSSSEFRTLGGQTQSVSSITEASNFLNTFILDESVDGDSEAAKALVNVVNVIANMDSAVTSASRRQESEAYDFVANYTELLKEADAPADIVDGFENVLDVLTALDTVRKNEQSTGALASYASVQEAYDDLFKEV